MARRLSFLAALALALLAPAGAAWAQAPPPEFSAQAGVLFTGAGVVVDNSCTNIQDVVIHWGDGTSSPPATQTQEGTGVRITGAHTYAAPGDYLGSVDLTATCTTGNGPQTFRVIGTPGGYPLGFIVHVGGSLPAPVLGKAVNVSVVKGKVLIATPGQKFVPLDRPRQIPVGSQLDTRNGTVRLSSATGSGAATQIGDFSGGVFKTLQSAKAAQRGLTELRLTGSSFKPCTARSSSAFSAAKSRRKIRRLRGNAKGRFRTRGRYSSATVRGTDWTVTDRCDGTLTTVKSGKVAVADFRRKKTVTVRKGKSYLARGG